MFLIFVTGVLLWLTYGLMIGDLPIILANSMTLLLAGSILLCKLIYR
jgi:MtN3 and saliva related transmembrane protein